ncbi:MAG: hypothetical protein AB1916_04120 [Thermodesulfobacteriota bacterium]
MAFFVICSLLALSVGCGKKAWPKPDAKGEAIALTQEAAGWSNACLGVSAVLTGKPGNLERLVLELAPADCPGCPFQPVRQMEFRPGGPGFVMDPDTGRLLLRACGLDQAAGVRWRLLAYNVYRTLPPAVGQDHVVPPGGSTP